jgi:hypothetical protein
MLCIGESSEDGFVVVIWRSAGLAQPGQSIMADLLGKRAFNEQVAHGFGHLVAEQASRVVLQASSRQPVSRPANISDPNFEQLYKQAVLE